jgi:peptidoglycan/LPS O-acetylase OafA/YrhL
LAADRTQEEASVPTQGRDVLLDAWRGISVLLVVFYHIAEFRFATFFRDPHHGSTAPERVGIQGVIPWIKHQAVRELEYIGPLGVQIFFVISGYIITTLILREHQRNGRVSIAAFYVRRAFRILPPLWLTLGLTLLFALLGCIHVDGRSILVAASFACNVQPDSCLWFTGHTWSVATEEQFYLLWPLLLVVFGFRNVAQAALVLCLMFIAADQYALLTVSWVHNALSGSCIAAGALFASSKTFRSLVARVHVVPLIVSVAFLLFGKPFLKDHIQGVSSFSNAVTPFLIVMMVFSCYRFRPSLDKLNVVRALAAIGLVSYGLYLWQELFLADPSMYLRSSILEFTPLLGLVVLLSYFLVERPLVKVGARLSRALISSGVTRATPAFALPSRSAAKTDEA